MKRIVAVAAVSLALLGAAPAPASAHIKVGMNCHIEGLPEQLSNHRVRIRWRISNRTHRTQTLQCTGKIITTTHFRFVSATATMPGRTFVHRTTITRVPGDLVRVRIVHGHIL